MTDLAWLDDYVGVPYVVNGRDRNGWDCWGVVLVAFRERRGVVLPDWSVSHDRDGHGELVDVVGTIADGTEQEVRAGRAMQLDEPEPWSIVMVHRRKLANHVGVVVENHVLHCSERTGGTVCEPLDRFLRNNVHCTFWRWLGA